MKLALAFTKEMLKPFTEETHVRETLWLRKRPGLHFVKMEMALSWSQVVAPAAEPCGLKRSLTHVSHIPKDAPSTRMNIPPDVATLGKSVNNGVKTGAAINRVILSENCARELDSTDTARDLC